MNRPDTTIVAFRGKTPDPNRPPQVDYNFNVVDGKVIISVRKRGSPMDKLVSELMILANSEWSTDCHRTRYRWLRHHHRRGYGGDDAGSHWCFDVCCWHRTASRSYNDRRH